MAKILKKERLSEFVWRYRIEAPRIAAKRKAGQFVILRPVQNSERIPLTIANADSVAGWIEIIFQNVGRTTFLLSTLGEGNQILDLAGPLGKPTHIEKFGTCLCIGGGVGTAPLFPIMSALKNAGNEIVTIIGARSKGLLILENEIKTISDEFYIATDDGSYGRRGFVTDVFKSLISENKIFDTAFVIGPLGMMKGTSSLTIASGIKTFVSLNPIMIDGTGMCGGCRVSIYGETRFACVDGPEFEAAGVDWTELLTRQNSYKIFESEARQKHQCKVEGT